MSHHGDGKPPEFKEIPKSLDERIKALHGQVELGPTGQFPEGKLKEDDHGEIRIAIGHQPGKVVMDFGDSPITWIGFNPVQAKQIAMMLMEHAEECLIIRGGS